MKEKKKSEIVCMRTLNKTLLQKKNQPNALGMYGHTPKDNGTDYCRLSDKHFIAKPSARIQNNASSLMKSKAAE